jgi:hypothetical protein
MPLIIGTTEETSTPSLAVATGTLFEYYPYHQGVADPVLWRFGDFKYTLLELTIRRDDRAIVGVALPIFRGRRLEAPPAAFERRDCRSGVPVVDALHPGVTRLDERRDLAMYVGRDRAVLILDDPFPPESVECISANRVAFYVSERRLVGIAFQHLQPTECDALLRILDEPRS